MIRETVDQYFCLFVRSYAVFQLLGGGGRLPHFSRLAHKKSSGVSTTIQPQDIISFLTLSRPGLQIPTTKALDFSER